MQCTYYGTGREVLPVKLGGVCGLLPHNSTKSVIFPTLFITWLNIQYHIFSSFVQIDVKALWRPFVDSLVRDEESNFFPHYLKSAKTISFLRLKWQNRYPVSSKTVENHNFLSRAVILIKYTDDNLQLSRIYFTTKRSQYIWLLQQGSNLNRTSDLLGSRGVFYLPRSS